MLNPTTRFARFTSQVVVISLLALYAPAETIGEMSRKAVKDLTSAPSMKASRDLTAPEMKKLSGKAGANPYWAGSSKWGINIEGVDVTTGNFSMSATDLSYEGGYGVPIAISRSYSMNSADEGPLGYGWNLSVDIRTTAGGLMKSASSPVRSVATEFKERPTSERVNTQAPGVAGGKSTLEPVDAVVSTDASGNAEIISRDVDGILTPPSWDQNEYINVDEEYSPPGSSDVYTILKSQTVITPDGTTYQYSAHGSYPGGMRDGRSMQSGTSAPLEPSNVLKIDTITDRHGNVTTYSYSGTASYAKVNGSVTEDKLSTISGAGSNHVYTFTWSGNRITGISENGGSRTVAYTYDGGYLASHTSPGGKTTSYHYGVPLNSNGGGNLTASAFDSGASYFLDKITDPRGLETKLYNKLQNRAIAPYMDFAGAGVATLAILRSNATQIHFLPLKYTDQFHTHIQNGLPGTGSMENRLLALLADYDSDIVLGLSEDSEYLSHKGVTVLPVSFDSVGNVASYNGLWSSPISCSYTYTDSQYPQYATSQGRDFMVVKVPNIDMQTSRGSTKVFSLTTGHLVYEQVDSDAVGVDHNLSGRVENTSTVNFLGQPLESVQKEYVNYSINNPNDFLVARRTFYAYWGKGKFYQQKAVVDPSGRVAWTDYYSSSAAQGFKGQTKQVVRTGVDSAVYNTFGNGTTGYTWVDAEKPFGTTVGDSWRGAIVPSSGAIAAAKFDDGTNSTTAAYDSHGRVIEVKKLQKVVTGTATYVTTHSNYGSDGSPWFGNADWVTEAYGTSSARTTTTNEQDSAGRSKDVTDANGRRFKTTYDADGLVQNVELFDNDVNSSASFSPYSIATYTYGTTGIYTGMVDAVLDGQSGEEQIITYYNNSSEPYRYGQVKAVASGDSSSVLYNYNSNGERSSVKYHSVNPENFANIDRYVTYNNYKAVGSIASPSRVFTNMSVATSAYNPTAEQFLYEYDHSGRLVSSAFAVTLVSDWSTDFPNGRIEVDNTKMTSYGKAIYGYDQGGRTKQVKYQWLSKATGSWVTTDLRTCDYNYNLKTGLRSQFAMTNGQTPSASYTENYDYDTRLDYLQGVDYNNAGGYENTWGYDASGNRVTENYGTAKASQFDELNRMISSQSGAKTYVHDKVGNRKTSDQNGARQTMTWDATNRMETIVDGATPGANPQVVWGTNSEYIYRADGLRVMKVVHPNLGSIEEEEDPSSFYDFNYIQNDATTKYYYDGQMCSGESYVGYADQSQNTVNQDLTNYTLGARGIDMIEGVRIGGAANDPLINDVRRSFPLYDGHGNMIGTLIRGAGNTGSVTNDKKYDAWGAAFVQSGPGGALVNPNIAYCANLGHKSDDESGLQYMRARYYEPGTGRFVSQDMARQGWNWFAYCGNNPVMYSDESGNSYTACQVLHLLGSIMVALGKLLMVDQFLGRADFIEEAIESVITKMMTRQIGGDAESDIAIGIYVDLIFKVKDMMHGASNASALGKAGQVILGRNLVILGLLAEIAAGTHGMDGVDFLDGGLGDHMDAFWGSTGL